jgi:glycosyltransferase involved in cell wall biosynthesis
MTSSNAPFFTVIVPVHNKAPHVSRSIGSVLGQSYGNFELLVIDDASTDGSLQEVEKFSDPRIRVLPREIPGAGGYAARNLGLQHAKADWIAFLDADDEWTAWHLQKMHDLIVKNPDVAIFTSGWLECEGADRRKNRYFLSLENQGDRLIDLTEYLRYCIRGMCPISTNVVVLRRSLLPRQALFSRAPGVYRGGDLDAWLSVMCKHKRLCVSGHVGATYFRDSVNMVTKGAPSSAVLVSKAAFQRLSQGLAASESRLLARYMNRKLYGGWRWNKDKKHPNYSLLSNLHWSAAPLNSCAIALAALFPASWVRSLKMSFLRRAG